MKVKTQLNPVKFIHIREYDGKGNVLPNAGMTIAFTKVKDEGLSHLYLATRAFCSERDNFCKRIGRSIAKGRLECGIYDEVRTTHTTMKDVANTITAWAMAD